VVEAQLTSDSKSKSMSDAHAQLVLAVIIIGAGLAPTLLRYLKGRFFVEPPVEEKDEPFEQKRLLILRLLAKRVEAYGLELVEASEGEIGRGTIYVYLDSLEEEGLIRSFEVPLPPEAHPQAIPRRRYRITSLGRGRAARK
jgi:DNA-binding transcriptional ArsR family regulator